MLAHLQAGYDGHMQMENYRNTHSLESSRQAIALSTVRSGYWA